MAITCSIVDITVNDNGTFQDAVRFGATTDTWSLAGMTFKMEVKADRADINPLVTWTSGAGQIVIVDATARVIQFNVPYTTIQASLPPACYVYDLLMLDGSTPAIRTPMMQGKFTVKRGVTED